MKNTLFFQCFVVNYSKKILGLFLSLLIAFFSFSGLTAYFHFSQASESFVPAPLGVNIQLNSNSPLAINKTLNLSAIITTPAHDETWRDWDFWTTHTKMVSDYDSSKFVYNWTAVSNDNSFQLSTNKTTAIFKFTQITTSPVQVIFAVYEGPSLINSSEVRLFEASEPKNLHVSIISSKGNNPTLEANEALFLSSNATSLNQYANVTLPIASTDLSYTYIITSQNTTVLSINGQNNTYETGQSSTIQSTDGNLDLAFATAFYTEVWVHLQVTDINQNSLLYNQTSGYTLVISSPNAAPEDNFDAITPLANVIVQADGSGWYRAINGITGSIIPNLLSTSANTTLNGALTIGGTIVVMDGSYSGAQLNVLSNVTLIAEPSVTGITYLSIADGARIDEPTFNACFGVYRSGSYTIVTGSSAVAGGSTWYLAFNPDNQVYWSSTNASSTINNALNNPDAGRTWQEQVLINGNMSLSAPIYVPSYTYVEVNGTLTRTSYPSGTGYGSTVIGEPYSAPAGITDVTIDGGSYNAGLTSANSGWLDGWGDNGSTVMYFGGSGIIIENAISIRGDQHGIFLTSGESNLIQNCNFTVLGTPIVLGTSYSTVKDCTINGAHDESIAVSGHYDTLDNLFVTNGGSVVNASGAIFIYDGASNIQIIDSMVEQNSNNNGLQIINSSNVLVSGGDFSYNPNGIWVENSSDVTLTGSSIYCNEYNGVAFMATVENEINSDEMCSNLQIYDNGQNSNGTSIARAGIQVYYTQDSTFTNLSIFDNQTIPTQSSGALRYRL